MRTRSVRFTIHANDAGTEAYRDGYVQELKHALADAVEAMNEAADWLAAFTVAAVDASHYEPDLPLAVLNAAIEKAETAIDTQ